MKNLQYNVESNEIFLDKKASDIIKGVAIILMLIHHFWGFPQWIIESNKYSYMLINSLEIEVIIGGFGKICVAIYAFITGYAIYINRCKYVSLKYRVMKIIKLLLNYWIFAFGFIIVGYLMNERLPDLIHFIHNLFGGSTAVFEYGKGYICVTMAWYVSFYISIMLILPILLIHTNKGFFVDAFLMSIIFPVMYYIFNITSMSSIPIIGGLLSNILIYGKCVLIGYYIAQYKVFEIINDLLKINSLLKVVLAIIICISIFIMRTEIPSLHLDYIYAAVFVFAIILMYKECIKYKVFTWIEKVILLISTESLNIWFIHSIFFTPERKLQFIAYWLKNSVLIVLWTILLILPICKIITKIQDRIWNKIYKLITYTRQDNI